MIRLRHRNIERLHRTMRQEFFNINTYDTIEDNQVALDAWVNEYNTERAPVAWRHGAGASF